MRSKTNRWKDNKRFEFAIIIVDCIAVFGSWQLTQFLLSLDRDMGFVIGWLWALTIAFALIGAPFMIAMVVQIFEELWKKKEKKN